MQTYCRPGATAPGQTMITCTRRCHCLRGMCRVLSQICCCAVACAAWCTGPLSPRPLSTFRHLRSHRNGDGDDEKARGARARNGAAAARAQRLGKRNHRLNSSATLGGDVPTAARGGGRGRSGGVGASGGRGGDAAACCLESAHCYDSQVSQRNESQGGHI